jgi:hypothetical protein
MHQGQENASKAYQQDITDEKSRNREGDILGQANAASGGMGDTGPTGMQLFGLPNYDSLRGAANLWRQQRASQQQPRQH